MTRILDANLRICELSYESANVMPIYEYANSIVFAYSRNLHKIRIIRMTSNKIIYKDLCYKLNGIFFKVHNELGRFVKEKQCADLAEEYLIKLGIPYKREFEIKFSNSIKPIGRNRVDFLIDNKIIVDFKCKRFVSREDYAQMQRYLKAANLKLGLIVNFNQRFLKPRRIINSSVKE